MTDEVYVDDTPVPPGEEQRDLDGDGVYDTTTVLDEDGAQLTVVDTDGDTRADTAFLDLDGDGTDDVTVTERGQGYLARIDDDGDGRVDRSLTLTREELAEQAPELVERLDTVFDDVASDEPGPALSDGDDTLASTEGYVSNGQLVGDPTGASEHWFQQAANGYCVPASVAQIVSEYTGVEYADEQAFVDRANELGVFVYGPDGVPGITAEGALELLEASGVPADMVYGGNGEMLAEYLAGGHSVMVAVDSGEYWYGESTEDNAPDHMVVVAGIDEEHGVVLLSDPGHPDGDLMEVPIEVFMDAWEDSGNAMIVCEEPSPHSAASGPSPNDDPDSVVELVVKFVVNWATGQPWALVPVTVPVDGRS